MIDTPYFSTPNLPWDRSADEEKRFRRLVLAFLAFFVVFTAIVPLIPQQEKQREQVDKLPPRLAKLVMEKKKPPPPPPPPKKEEKPKEEKPKEEKKKEEKPKEEKKKTAKEKAKAAIAVFDDLADLRDQDQLKQLDTKKELKSLGADETKTERSLLTKMAGAGSGGVSVSKASSGGGGSGTLAGAATTAVESSLGDAAGEIKKRQGGQSRRTTEDIQLVFDRHKGSIFSLYRRALRGNPALEGAVVLRLVIQPSGAVSRCDVVSSELNDPTLERKIVLKVKQINFGAKDVDVWDDTYPLNFIPS